MTDILKELYDSTLNIDREPSEDLLTLRKKEAEIWEKILPILGMEMIDNLNDIQADISNEKNLAWFREGFRLGASLMLELL